MRIVENLAFAEFEWDEKKRLSTIEKSGVDFRIVAPWLLEPHLEAPSPRSGEPRIQAICGSKGRTVVIVYVVREGRCRIISAWPADRNEQGKYRQIFSG
jgi:uncharacterized DUF497 family protein